MDTLFLRVSVGILAGFLMGCVFVFARLRSGLTKDEWLYFKSFLQALRDGNYEHVSDDERSEDDGTQD